MLSRAALSEFSALPTCEVRYYHPEIFFQLPTSHTPRCACGVNEFGVVGNLRSLNDLAKSARADYIIHTGDFGFYDETSLERIADK